MKSLRKLILGIVALAAFGSANVFAQDENLGVAGHLFPDGFPNSFYNAFNGQYYSSTKFQVALG